jgi:hypothetical protein
MVNWLLTGFPLDLPWFPVGFALLPEDRAGSGALEPRKPISVVFRPGLSIASSLGSLWCPRSIRTDKASPDCVRLRTASQHCLLSGNLKGQTHRKVMTQSLRSAGSKDLKASGVAGREFLHRKDRAVNSLLVPIPPEPKRAYKGSRCIKGED